jgi:uncharacterized protein (TIGR00290 family)
MATTGRLKVALSWSSGKDSAWALWNLRADPRYEIVALLTTFNAAADRVAMHAVRRQLVEAQAGAARLPLWSAEIPFPCSNDQYEEVMRMVIARSLEQGIDAFAFGDLFLRDVREYRERQLASTGIAPIFPLWERPTDTLAKEMIAGGLRARLTCIDPRVLPRDFAGREFDSTLLTELPAGVDPCGERGEFHTFAWAGPMFDQPLSITTGQILERDGFVFADLLPAA